MASSSIDKQKKQPIYQQIVTHFIEEIQAGIYGPGDRLPPERLPVTPHQPTYSVT